MKGLNDIYGNFGAPNSASGVSRRAFFCCLSVREFKKMNGASHSWVKISVYKVKALHTVPVKYLIIIFIGHYCLDRIINILMEVLWRSR